MENHKLNSVFLTILSEGSHYQLRCDAAKRTPVDRFTTYSNIVNETIRRGHGYMWWSLDDFSFDEIVEIIKALDEYQINHLAECRRFASTF